MLNLMGRRACAGVTLVELIAFLVVISIGAVALLGSYRNILPRAPTPAQVTQANLLAQERMELIIGQKALLGFSSVALDPCRTSSVGVCTLPSGFSIVVVGDNVAPTPPTRQVTVTVSASGTQLARQVVQFSSY
jgi:Tfp pilus assembly protein PilE